MGTSPIRHQFSRESPTFCPKERIGEHLGHQSTGKFRWEHSTYLQLSFEIVLAANDYVEIMGFKTPAAI